MLSALLLHLCIGYHTAFDTIFRDRELNKSSSKTFQPSLFSWRPSTVSSVELPLIVLPGYGSEGIGGRVVDASWGFGRPSTILAVESWLMTSACRPGVAGGEVLEEFRAVDLSPCRRGVAGGRVIEVPWALSISPTRLLWLAFRPRVTGLHTSANSAL